MVSSRPGPDSSFFILEPCASANGFEIKFKDKEKRIDLKKAETALSKLGTTMSGPSVLAAKLPFEFKTQNSRLKTSITLSVYGSGRIMIKAQDRAKKMSKAHADQVAKYLLALFEKNNAIL